MNLTKNKISKLKKKKNQSRKKFKYNKKYKHHNTYKKKKQGHIKNNTLKKLKGGMPGKNAISVDNETMKEHFENSNVMCGNKTGLNKIFNKYGYYLGEVPGDGDCMYSAFKLALNDQPLVKDLTIKAIRQRVFDYITVVYNGKTKSSFMNKNDIDAAIVADLLVKDPNANIDLSKETPEENQQKFNNYVKSINTPGNYGDHLVFSILQNEIFDVSVTVYQCSQNRKVNNKIERTVVNYEYNGSNKKKGDIILYLQDNNDSSAHYDPVLKLSTGTKMGPVDIGPETQPTQPVVATAASKLTRPPNLLKPPISPKPATTNTNIQVNQSTIGPVNIGPAQSDLNDVSKNKELKVGDLIYYNENVSNTDPKKYIAAKIEKINKEKDITTYNLIYVDSKNKKQEINNVNLKNIQQSISKSKLDNSVSATPVAEPVAAPVEAQVAEPVAAPVVTSTSSEKQVTGQDVKASAPPLAEPTTLETTEQGKIKIITRATPIDDNLKRIDISIIAPNNVETIVKDYSKDNATQALSHL